MIQYVYKTHTLSGDALLESGLQPEIIPPFNPETALLFPWLYVSHRCAAANVVQ